MTKPITSITSLGGISKGDWIISVSQNPITNVVMVVVYNVIMYFSSVIYFETPFIARQWIAIVTGDDMLDFLSDE